jgi:putative SbcD/Mre11-related phosphoesterase
MVIKFLTDYPALFIPEEKILVIADLHIGIEHELYQSGIVIPPQAEKFSRTIGKLVKATKAETLVILGDIKHLVPGISYREMKEIPKLFSSLVEKVKVIVCIGNHDTYLEDLLPEQVEVCNSRGFRIGKYGFFHGHAWPSEKLMECDWLLMAHIHPVIEFVDSFGYRNVEQVWVRGKLNEEIVKKKYKIDKCGKLEAIIFPTFNRLLGGLALNSAFNKEYLGPLLENVIDVDKCKLYLLDGTFLGSVKNLKK